MRELGLALVFFLASCGSQKTVVQTKSKTLTAAEQSKFDEAFIDGVSLYIKEDFVFAKEKFFYCLKKQPDHAASAYQLAWLYKDLSVFDSALFFSNRAQQLDPNNVWYRQLYGDLLWINRERKKAIEVYEFLLANNPGTRAYYKRLDEFYSREQNWSAREQLAIKELGYFGKNFQRLRRLSNILLNQKKVEEAITLWEEAIDSHPKRAAYYKELSGIYSRAKKIERLELLYSRAFKELPYNRELSESYVRNVLIHKPLESRIAFIEDKKQPKSLKYDLVQTCRDKDEKSKLSDLLIQTGEAPEELILKKALSLSKDNPYKALDFFNKLSAVPMNDEETSLTYLQVLIDTSRKEKAGKVLAELKELFPFSEKLKKLEQALNEQ